MFFSLALDEVILCCLNMSSQLSNYVIPKFTGDILRSEDSKLLTNNVAENKLTSTQGEYKGKLVIKENTAKQATGVCFVCRKESDLATSNLAIRRCTCSSVFLHDQCMVKTIVSSLDKPCQMCGQFYTGTIINSRVNMLSHESNQVYIRKRNASVFKSILASVVAAYFILEHIQGFFTKQATYYQHFRRMFVVPLWFLLVTIVIYKKFQVYLQSPTSLYYFSNHSRMLVYRDPQTQHLINLYVRSNYGLLIDTTNGKGRFINKHLLDVKPKWRLLRLMEP